MRSGLFLAIALCFVFGCSHGLLRLPAGNNPERIEIPTKEAESIGDMTRLWGATSVDLWGVGIVRGLPGNGGFGAAKQQDVRLKAINALKKNGIDDPVAFLAEPDVAVVVVRGRLPAGVQKGDPIDISVELTAGDPTPSLRGGYLMPCELREYADAGSLTERQGARGTLEGNVLAKGRGPLLVGVGAESEDRLRSGFVWGGGRALIDRNFALLVYKERAGSMARQSRLIADRINERFQTNYGGAIRMMAEAKNPTRVTLRVPQQYKHNLPRYMRVIRQIPLRQSAVERNVYREELARQVLDPETAMAAALKLEALGQDSLKDLKLGLSHSHPFVRFCSAEALAYLGDPACGEVLAQLIEEEPRLRAYSLAAMASLDEAVCHVKLRELMGSSSAETRYGAFCALRALDEKDPALGEEIINERFHLHRVATHSEPMVHIAGGRRAELVLFGTGHQLVPPLSLQVGSDFVITAPRGTTNCVIARIAVDGDRRETSSLDLESIVRAMGGMGANYSDIVDLVQEAAAQRTVSCRVELDARPRAPSVYSLASVGANENQPDEEQGETGRNPIELVGIPNLFARTAE